MRTPEEALAALTRDTGRELLRVRLVSSVNDDGTVNLAFGNQVADSVPALASYTPRAAGDKVAVVQVGAGSLVLGKIGAEASPALPDVPTVDFGEKAPGVGWSKGAGVYVREGGIYVDTSTAGGGGGGAKVPGPRTVQPAADGAYRFGTLDASQPGPIQGAWSTSSYPAWSGAWFYGTGIKTACDAGTVDFIEMRVARSGSYHGNPRGVPTRLYLHAATTRGSKMPGLFNPHTGPSLQLGQVATFRLPGDWVTALAGGTAKGVGCTADKGPDYLIYGPGCGQVTVHYK